VNPRAHFCPAMRKSEEQHRREIALPDDGGTSADTIVACEGNISVRLERR